MTKQFTNYVKCEICGEHLRYITDSHLKTHGFSLKLYKVKFPNSPIASDFHKSSSANRGSHHHNWKGGISKNSYKHYILNRDDHHCQLCNSNSNLCIVRPNTNKPKTRDNLITLCRPCLNKFNTKSHHTQLKHKLSRQAKRKEKVHKKKRKNTRRYIICQKKQ